MNHGVEFQSFDEWIKYDYIVRHCSIYGKEVIKILNLPINDFSWGDHYNAGERIIKEYARVYGENIANAHLEIIRKLGLNPGYKERFLFDKRMKSKQLKIFHNNQPQIFLDIPIEFTVKSSYNYKTPDGNSSYGYLVNIEFKGKVYSFPATMWECIDGGMYLDILSFQDNYPLYNLDVIENKSDKYPYGAVIICINEEQVEFLKSRFRHIYDNVALTTWLSGELFTLNKTDWGRLEKFDHICIVVDDSPKGFEIAFNLNKELEKTGYRNVTYILPKKRSSEINQNKIRRAFAFCSELSDCLAQLATDKKEDFFRLAKERYGLAFDEALSALSLEEFMTLPMRAKGNWVVPELVRKGDRVMVYAKAKQGKTTFLIQTAIMMANHGLKVVYFDAEMKKEDFCFHANRALRGRNKPESLYIVSADQTNSSLDFENIDNINKYKDIYNSADVIIFDNLNKMFHSSLESSSGSSKQLDEFVDSLWKIGKTVILVHHASRSGNAFGTSAKQFGLELTLKIEKRAGCTRVIPEEARNLSEKYAKPFDIPFSEDGGLSDDWFDPEKRYSTPKTENDLHAKITEENVSNIEQNSTVEVDKIESEYDTTDRGEETKGHALETVQHEDTTIRNSPKEEKKERLRKLDESEPGLSIREAAERLGISKSTVSNLRKELEKEKLS